MNQSTIYSKPQINKIFPEINFDNFNYNSETNNIIDDYFINDNFNKFDKFFNDKRSNISSYDENDYQKVFQNKSILNTSITNSENKFNFNKKENNIKYISNFNVENWPNNFILEKVKGNDISLTYKNNNNLNKNDEKKNKYEINDINKKIIDNSVNPKFFIENKKQEQKIKNKLSARKSRLKKKLYLQKLENELVSVKNELNEIKIKQKAFLNEENSYNNKNQCENCKHFDELKSEENNLIINQENNDKNKNIIFFSKNQQALLEQLLIKQIQIMMPIKIKIFQNKYLKLSSINDDDTLSVIKNKIDKNLEALQELYDINNFKYEDNGVTKINEYKIKSKSMSHQIYNFYYNLKNYVRCFEQLYLSLN